MNINGKTELYGILGHPVGHSLSPIMQNAAFSAMEMNCVYVAMNVEAVSDALKGLMTLGFKGVSVTIPHKEKVLEHLDDIDPVAQRIGAVNTLLFIRSSTGTCRIHGFNTDWIGAKIALEEHLPLGGRSALIAGAGGAAKAVGYGLLKSGCRILVTNRTERSGRELADALGCGFVSFQDLDGIEAEIFVNTTSVGMTPNFSEIIIDPGLLPRFKVVMDIVYAPLQTRLLTEAKAAGCKVVDGLAMLLHQGAAQFEIWTGRKPPLDIMRQSLEDELHSREKKR